MSWLVLAIIVLLVLAVVVNKKVQETQRKRKRNLRQRQVMNELRQFDFLAEPLPPSPTSPLLQELSNPITKLSLSLKSDVGIDYTHLQDLLEAMRWQEADAQTKTIMLKLTGCETQGYIDSQNMQKLPCIDLQTIDCLWLKYSNGHFGFSVQSRLWQESRQDCSQFGNLVGWSKQGVFIREAELIYDLSAPAGHLPVAYVPIVGSCLWIVLDSIFFLNQRFRDCCRQNTN